MLTIPDALAAKRALGPEWASWLDGLGRLASEMMDAWELEQDGDPLHGGTALVLPVRDAAGARLVLKLGFPDPDNAGEAAALKAWRGLGAVRLERADPRRGVLLLERLGRRDLSTLDAVGACEVVGGLYRRLHVPAPPTVPELAPHVARWLSALDALGRDVPAPPRFVQQALRAGGALLADAPRRVLHGDLHPGNVLAGRREPWLAIDPKGFAGDPCYEPGPLLWNSWDAALATGDPGGAVRERFYAVVDAAGLDERRCRDWVVVRAMIAVSWEVEDAARAARPLDASQRDRITRAVTVAKAMQAVAP